MALYPITVLTRAQDAMNIPKAGQAEILAGPLEKKWELVVRQVTTRLLHGSMLTLR